jgi:starch synthase (maltosyl-transferring)
VEVTADIHADGHDVLRAVLRWRETGEAVWREATMDALPNDVWRGAFLTERETTYEFVVEGWVDRFRTWARDLARRVAAEAWEDVPSELLEGARIVEEAAGRSSGSDAEFLAGVSRRLAAADGLVEKRVELARSRELLAVMDRHADRRPSAIVPHPYKVQADPPLARFSTWYELFPRSRWGEGDGHGSLREVEERIAGLAAMGFDVLYLPPVHPIGRTHRKGPNNSESASADDVGSPWAIGAADGGHTDVHPALGTVQDLERLVTKSRDAGVHLALDLAFQCSPDHPWVREHPGWFRHRPDGTIRYAENPPKKYQDIYPLNFECDDWKGLWEALLGVVEFWVDRGIRVFRVDNPHTKPYAFWEWLLAEIRARRPDVIFLSEAFTRPKVIARLAKLGFHQSYTYFTWRNTADELRSYLSELTRTGLADYFRPNLWPNTPDILPEFLQAGGEPAFRLRLVLAATLSSSYGIYGPAFEMCEARPVAPGKEEYLDSEKYQLRQWDMARGAPVRALITRINRIRRENPALQTNQTLRFHPTDQDDFLVYSKQDARGENLIVVVANLSPHYRKGGNVTLEGLGLETGGPYQMHDLLGGARYLWSGGTNYVELDPGASPAHVFRVQRRLRTERDFDYWL